MRQGTKMRLAGAYWFVAMHYAEVVEEAIRLRSTRGLSLSEIAHILAVPKSTVYYWVKGVPLPMVELSPSKAEAMKANQQAATAAMQAKYAALRQRAYDEAYVTASELLQDRDIRDFVVLYLAEGYRKNKNVVAVGNSSPCMMQFVHRCLKRLSSKPRFYYTFQFHADQDPEQLRRFWASCLDIEPEQIRPLPKTNSGHLKGRRFACEYGVFQIQVADTTFRAQLQALMDVVQEQWAGTG
jgi:transposase-like protein